jgi:Family of unknown function (DUF5329)
VNIRNIAFGTALGFWFACMGYAAPPPANAQNEINYLFQFLDASTCEFYRNGSWYDGKRARAHLHDKYVYLLARNQIESAEDFIEKAATKSSLSGRPYAIRCQDGIVVPSNAWFRHVLAVFRLSYRTPVVR